METGVRPSVELGPRLGLRRADAPPPEAELGHRVDLRRRKCRRGNVEATNLLQRPEHVPRQGADACLVAEAARLGIAPPARDRFGDQLAPGDEVVERPLEHVGGRGAEADGRVAGRHAALLEVVVLPRQLVVVVADERRGDPAVRAPVDEAGVVLDEPLDDLLVEIAPPEGGPVVVSSLCHLVPPCHVTRLTPRMFFSLNSWQLALVLAVIMFGATGIGLYRRPPARPSQGDAARAVRRRPGRAPDARRPAARLHAGDGGDALRGAAGRGRRRLQRHRHGVPPRPDAARADALGLAARSIPRMPTRASLSRDSVPGSGDAKRAIAEESQIQRQLWRLAGQSLDRQADPTPRLGSTSRASTR